MGNRKVSSFGSLFLFTAVIVFMTYGLQRSETALLLSCYALLFGIYVWVLQQESNTRFWLLGSMFARISLLFALPNLSDDFYRFVWDGRLWEAGQHPFLAVPSEFLKQHLYGVDSTLFAKLNSKENFTVYPPLAQCVFWLSVKLSNDSVLGSVIVMRLLIIAAEGASFVLIVKLLRWLHLPEKKVLLYSMNPLVILELTGNLHFEAFVIFFLLLSVWWLSSARRSFAAFSFACAIGMKLLPMMFLPLLPALMGWRRALIFYLIVCVSLAMFFLPLYDQRVLEGFSQSLHLYFDKFEFNASLYYLVRAYGLHTVGYNTIQAVGWKLGIISGSLMLLYSVAQWGKALKLPPQQEQHRIADLWKGFLCCSFLYLIFSTTIHPWYVVPVLLYSVFARFRFPVVWTAMIFLTYAGYVQQGFFENLWLTTAEYVCVFGYLGVELLCKDRSISATSYSV